MKKRLTKGLSKEVSELATKAFLEGMPGVYGVPECLDEMFEKLAHHGYRLVKIDS